MLNRKVKIAICGINGKMGQVVLSCVNENCYSEAVAGVDIKENLNSALPVFRNVSDINVDFDVIIDFSHPSLLTDLLSYATQNKKPVVICTTGYTQQQVEEIKKASEVIPVFYSGNMSLGINLLIELSKKARQILGDGFDVEILEKHHNQKIDAPSGTAFMIADAISSVSENDMKYMYDRHSFRKKREKNEIGLHSVRAGTIVGEHEVIFAGRDEVISLTHTAQSKEVFAVGAVRAAVFLSDKTPNMYSMKDMIEESNN